MGSTAFVLLIVAATMSSITAAMELPSSFRTCNRTLKDPEYDQCIADAARDAMTSLARGLKSFKILPAEPLVVDSVKIGESQGSVSVRQEYRNIKLYGLTKNLKIKRFHIDWDTCTWSSISFNPRVEFVADYKVEGKILVLPVRGAGKSNITMYDLESTNTIYCEKYEQNGETYLRVKKFAVKFSPARVSLQFDNLFGGDTVLGEQMNRFINENSDLLFKELQAPYEETFGLVFAKISNNIFSRVPLKKIFPPA